MNTRQWIADTIASEGICAIPIMTHPGIELIGKTVRDAVSDGQVHFEAIKALHEKYPQSAAATVIMDLTVEAEAFGSPIVMADDEVPSVSAPIVTSLEEVQALQIPSLKAGRIQEYLKANRLCASYFTDKPTFAGCIGPFSLAGRLYDMTAIMMAIYLEPDTIKLLLEKCTNFLISYLKAQRETGVSGVVLAEPAAGLLSNEDCTEFSSVYVKRIIEAVQTDSFVVILHNCGNMGHCTQAMLDTGAIALHMGNRVNMAEALKICPSDVMVMGNIDPVAVMKSGSAEDVECAVRELIAQCRQYPNFVLSTGCDTPPLIPAENIDAFYRGASS